MLLPVDADVQEAERVLDAQGRRISNQTTTTMSTFGVPLGDLSGLLARSCG